MVTKIGELYVGRQPQYLRGVANIKFAVEQMQKVQPNADYDRLTVVGHSAGADISVYFAKLGNLDTSMYMLGWGGGSSDAIFTLKPVLHSRDTKGSGDGNYGDTKNARLDELTDGIEGEMDAGKRNAMIAEAMKIVQDEVLRIPLHRQVIPWVSKANITVSHQPNNFLTYLWVTVK